MIPERINVGTVWVGEDVLVIPIRCVYYVNELIEFLFCRDGPFISTIPGSVQREHE